MLRVLFVCGAATGGAPRSTLQLAGQLIGRGYAVEVVLANSSRRGRRRRRLYKRSADATTSLRRWRLGRVLAPALEGPQRWIGARGRQSAEGGIVPVVRSAVPENVAISRMRAWHPDVVVASSVERVAYRRLRARCRRDRIPFVLYMRGVSELGQLATPGNAPDLLLTNTRSVGETAAAAGHPATYIPSLIDVAEASVRSTRSTVLLVNPLRSHGTAIATDAATALPDIPFVFQESWELSDAERETLTQQVAGLANVELREPVPRASQVFADARLLLAPHQIDNRPRVVLEAQLNGIPVVATAQPGLIDQVGPGGILLPLDADSKTWAATIARLWDDVAEYEQLCERAVAHASRPEQRTETIVNSFDEQLRIVVRRGNA